MTCQSRIVLALVTWHKRKLITSKPRHATSCEPLGTPQFWVFCTDERERSICICTNGAFACAQKLGWQIRQVPYNSRS